MSDSKIMVSSSGLATLSLLATWVILDRTCHVIEHITVDRDPDTGWRAGAILLAAGAITGRRLWRWTRSSNCWSRAPKRFARPIRRRLARPPFCSTAAA